MSYGGLGLRSVYHHSSATYIASLSLSGLGSVDNLHLVRSVVRFNSFVSPPDSISLWTLFWLLVYGHTFGLVVGASTEADEACLLPTFVPYAASWLTVVPSIGLGLHLSQ